VIDAAPHITMEISIRSAVAEDRQRWDNYVGNHPQATPYQKYAWLEAVCDAYPHKNASLIAFNTNNEVVGVYPAILMVNPFIKDTLCALPYCDLGGPLTDDTQIEQQLEKAIRSRFLKSSKSFIDIRTNRVNNDVPVDFDKKKVRMLLDLPSSSEELLASFKSKLRSQIKKAEKNGLAYTVGRDTKLLEDFYRVYARNMRDLGSPAHSKKWFQSISEAYGEHHILSVVYKDDIPIGAGLVLRVSDKACIPWASTVRDYNRLAPNMLLYWSLLGHCADNGIRSFDFGRSTYEEGTYKFKKQWGAQPELLEWKKLYLSGEQEFVVDSSNPHSALRTALEGLWRKLPVSVSIAIGSRLRPYISL